MVLRDEQADSRAAKFGEDVRSDRGGPANQIDVFEEGGRIGKAEFRGALCEAIEQADGQVVRSRVDFGGEDLLATCEDSVGEGAADVDVNYPHGFLFRVRKL